MHRQIKMYRQLRKGAQMNRNEFMNEIRSRLTGLPEADIQKTLDFYNEALDDRMEDGLSEDQAVEALGTPAEIADKVLMETPLPTLVKAQPATEPRRKIKAWEIVLIVLGAPVWLPITIGLFAVGLSLALALIAVVLSLIFAVLATAVCGVAAAFGSLVGIIMGEGTRGLLEFAASLLAVGIAVLLFIPIKAGALWLVEMMGRMATKIKMRFIARRNRNSQMTDNEEMKNA